MIPCATNVQKGKFGSSKVVYCSFRFGPQIVKQDPFSVVKSTNWHSFLVFFLTKNVFSKNVSPQLEFGYYLQPKTTPSHLHVLLA